MDAPWWGIVSVLINFIILCVVLVYLYKKHKIESISARLGGEEYAEDKMLHMYANMYNDDIKPSPLDTDE